MNIQLMEGAFSSGDALELLTQLVQIKIRYHENRISSGEAEEDIKAREARIKRLQNQLSECRNQIRDTSGHLKIDARIKIDPS